MITYREAVAIIERSAAPLRSGAVPLMAAAGRTLAGAVHSDSDVPPFANAALDGYALRSTDTVGSTATRLRLRLLGSVIAGAAAPVATPAGAAWEITTGAALPGDCDAVVALEAAVRPDAPPGTVEVPANVVPGANRRLAGEDFRAGDLLADRGQALHPGAIMALAAAGVAVPQVVDVPRVAIITTGAELAASATACIHDANGPFLPSAVALAGGRALAPAPVGDDVTAIATAITAAASQAEVVITTGGVSTGALDLVPAALARLGATILFHRVAIRPGKPVLLARLPQAGPLVLGLPGNPVAVAVGWRFFGVPLLRRLLGQAPEEWLPARVSADLRRRPDLTFFAKAYAWVDQEALLRVAVLPGQESFKVRPLVRANCWAIAEADAATLQAGAILPVLPAVPGAFPGAAGPQ